MDINNLKKDAKNATDSPKSAIKYMLNCLYVYQKGKDDSALGYLGYVLAKSLMKEDSSAPSDFMPGPTALSRIKGLKEKMRENSVIATMGATWQNDYKDVDPDNYEINFKKEQKGDDEIFKTTF